MRQACAAATAAPADCSFTWRLWRLASQARVAEGSVHAHGMWVAYANPQNQVKKSELLLDGLIWYR